ncbi:Retrovirus-related Pol polyprotein from transposon RE1 [Erysiphe neolycopersici]|uniref:Retrovirus-related Pol polyprotein from transposon RE1 n=1 Tax=Erysiphe neolycopersici TaxID=212602 RepID=A0A420I118_9PEZI|nr:Retrovirus-related Pol polyprotein from transposon RE1 [Erysiphe neolycopersici]
MSSCYPVNTPMKERAKEWLVPYDKQVDPADVLLFQQIMGSLNYLAIHTRMDISFSCGALMRYLHNPSPAHIRGARQILRYLSGTIHFAIKFDKMKGDQFDLYGYSDANFANYDKAGFKPHSGWLFFMSSEVISSSSKLQTTVALSSTESELYGICMAAR